jgi:hypothetical protein
MADLEQTGALLPHEQERWASISGWFKQNLPVPTRFARSSKTHASKVALSWFRDTASVHIAKMREIAGILDEHGVVVEMLQDQRPGYVVYQDEHQVAAEPFNETST